jgi:hypothetical protein
MMSYEMLAKPRRDITPEGTAQGLRNPPEVHYKQKDEA